MAINPLIDLDLNLDEISSRKDELKPQGFRLLSLSMYGDPEDARFAAVWDKRGGPDWDFALGFTVHDMVELTKKHKKQNLYPRIVTATGGGVTKARMSVVFEKLEPPITRELSASVAPKKFAEDIRARLRDGWIPVTATIYDDAQNEPLIGAVWGKNSANTAWTALFAEKDKLEEQFNAELSGWARLAFITASTQSRFLSIYRDDHTGPIGQEFITLGSISRETFEQKKAIWLKDGLHTICLQGSGAGSNRSFVALAVKNESLVKRVESKIGGPEVPAIDDAVLGLMKQSNIRGAALAIVKGTKLVLARGYTWAEPDYPPVMPTTVFRLGSVSKLITALAIHQLAAEEGRIKLKDKVKEVLPLTPPNKLAAANSRYLTGQIHDLIERSDNTSPRYERESLEIAKEFTNNLPVTHEQIAKFWITKPLVADERLDDFGFFLAGQIVKQQRNQDKNLTMMNAAARITKDLQIKRIRSARSLLSTQLSDEARYHPRDLAVNRSVMSGGDGKFRPLVPGGYGDENLETMEASGGLSAAVTDLARILAAMNAEPYSPLGRPAVNNMLKSAIAKDGGHGFDAVEKIDPANEKFAFTKGGLLQTTQAGLYYRKDDYSYVIVWNGLLAGKGWDVDKDIEPEWYPKFNKVLTAAASLPDVDLFPQFKMDSFAPTHHGFRWCKKCQGLFDGTVSGICPAGSPHDQSASKDYTLMHSAAFKYGEENWRVCTKCRGLFFDVPGPKNCPASSSKPHQGFSTNYSLVKDSPYNEHQTKWRRCKKCQGLFFQGNNASVCPATGAHDGSDSGDYSLAFK